MKRPWRSQALRAICLGLVAGVAFLATGDRARATAPAGVGIDPFDVLDLQVKNNVLFIIDTSGSMKWPPDTDNFSLGDDDPASRIYQAKQAVNSVIQANRNTVNFGLATYNILDSSKPTVSQFGQDFDGDGQSDGPVTYVSDDPEAGLWLGTATVVGAVTGTGFFNGFSDTFGTYSPQTSAGIFASLMNTNGTSIAAGYGYGNAYPPGCTPGTTCRYYLQSRLLRNGTRYTWNRAAAPRSSGLLLAAPIVGGCPLPPAGLTGFNPDNNGDGLSDQPRPCFQLQNGVGGAVATYYYSSPIFESTSGAFCGGAAVLNSVAICSADNSPTIGVKMGPAAPTDAVTGVPIGFPAPVPGAAAASLHSINPPIAGLREDQSTPLAGSLDAIRAAAPPAFPPSGAAGQKNFVILVTDGDDTCAGGSTDRNAVIAAVSAQNLYQQGGFNPATGATTDFQHRAETMVIGFAAAVTQARIDVIAQGGSGATINGGSSNPSTAVTGCNPGGACRDAFTAQNTQQLVAALNNALQQAASAGEFSTTRSVFDAVPEYAAAVGPSPSPSPTPSPFDPMNPDNRFLGRTFRSYQTTFEMPTFRGHLRAFAASPSPTVPLWDAGSQLMNRIETSPAANDIRTAPATFDLLHGGLGGVGAPTFRPNLAARIDRRIFTNVRNGIAPDRVMLWPPAAAVTPADNTTAGSLDDILGVGPNSNPVLTFAQLQAAPFFACKSAAAPALPGGHACLVTTGAPAAQLLRARREAREMILAYMAGASVVRDANNFPVRTAGGDLRYLALPWLLAEDTLGPMVVVTPPSQTLPVTHIAEYVLFRDGPRINSGTTAGQALTSCAAQSSFSPFPLAGGSCTNQGFGLRNPDFDGQENPPNTGGTLRNSLKPVMSVVYLASNDMLHAFRAGPCPASVGAQCAPASQNGSAAAGVETGGEELWGFVPYDLLPKLSQRMVKQTRNNHTFMLAAGLRFADVFVPQAPFTIENRTYNGVWRRILVFGRGLGTRGAFGKYYSALDVTSPGPFTISSLDTQLPDMWWSRGNPDIQTIGSVTNNGTSGDATLFQNMGQTWSVPVVSRVDPANNVNQRLNVGREYVVYMGSGYGEVATEGTRFYTLDAITGDIVASADVGNGGAASFSPDFQNALVAPPAVFIPAQTVAGVYLPNPAGSLTTKAYIGDIHGRMWRFDSDATMANKASTCGGTSWCQLLTDLGRNQPIAAPAATMNLGTPYVFFGTGNDVRVPLPSPAPASGPFEVMGIQDNATPGTIVTGFPVLLPSNFRNTNPVRTAFLGVGQSALFSPTRFNPAVSQCVSSFDTTILVISATNGNTVYENLLLTGVKAVSDVKVTDPTRLPDNRDIDKGTPGAGGTPPAPAGVPPDKPGQPLPVTSTLVAPGTTICR